MSRKAKRRAAAKRSHKRVPRYFSRDQLWSRTLSVLKHLNNTEVDTESYQKVMLKPYLSFGQLRAGKAKSDDIAVLVQSFSFTQGLLLRFRDFSNLADEMQGMMAEVDAAEEALNSLVKRDEDNERFIGTGEELKAIGRCLGVLDGLVEVSTINHLSAALNHSIEEMNRRRARFEELNPSFEQVPRPESR